MPRIKRLEIKNCLGITELEIQAGKVNIISGGNEKGKTSVLEVIEKGLQNTQRRTRFIKDGADEATLYIEMDDTTTISRKEKADGKGSSKVTQHGASIPKPETYLKSLVGEGFGFNPIDFMSKKDKEQTDILLSLMPMQVTECDLQSWFGEVPPVNLNQHAIGVLAYLAEKHFYDRRTIANAEVKQCASEIKALFEQLPDNYDADQWREVNIGSLWAQVTESASTNNVRERAQAVIESLEGKLAAVDTRADLAIREHNDLLEFKIDKARKSVEGDRENIRSTIALENKAIAMLLDKIAEIQQTIEAKKRNIALWEKDLDTIDSSILATKIESLKNEMAIELKNVEEKRGNQKEILRAEASNAQAYLDAKPAVDTMPLEATAQFAETMKGYIKLYDNMKDLGEALSAKQQIASRLDYCVELARKKPAELLQQIVMPIKGLGINENMQVTIDDLPITNLSTSRQIKLALDIARATAGPLQIICIDRFESLDADQQGLLFQEIEADGFQYFISTVTEGDLKVVAQGVA